MRPPPPCRHYANPRRALHSLGRREAPPPTQRGGRGFPRRRGLGPGWPFSRCRDAEAATSGTGLGGGGGDPPPSAAILRLEAPSAPGDPAAGESGARPTRPDEVGIGLRTPSPGRPARRAARSPLGRSGLRHLVPGFLTRPPSGFIRIHPPPGALQPRPGDPPARPKSLPLSPWGVIYWLGGQEGD